MPNPARLWQLLSLILAGALFVALLQLHRINSVTQPPTRPLPIVNKMTEYGHLALSPNARRAHERYSL